jgi:hypothetical protein
MGSCALALDSGDVPHVVYFIRQLNGTDKTFNYTIQNGTGNNWVTATLPVSELHDDVDLVLDADGKPHIAAAKANFELESESIDDMPRIRRRDTRVMIRP